jgi:signal transduction histidine kinase
MQAGEDFELDYRTADDSGKTRWLIARGKVIRAADGTPVRLRGVSMDVTERHAAEAAARELGGRLISAQEDERRRIARELHDDINQRLGLLAVRLDAIRRTQPRDGHEPMPLDTISEQIKQLSSEIHELSTRLHPAKLDRLGLESTCRSLCRDLSAQAGITIEYVAEDVPSRVPGEVALGFFRILQEALSNAIKHSGSDSVAVHLTGGPNGLLLTVRDFGCGFDPADPAHQSGLGLISIRERARLIDARLQIYSSPGRGTRLELKTGLVPPEPTDPS